MLSSTISSIGNMFPFTECMCECTLRAGAFIVSVMSAVSSVGSLMSLLIARHQLPDTEPTNPDERDAWLATRVLIKFAATDVFLTLIIDGILIIGILKEKSIMMVPWLLVSGISLVVYVVPLVSIATLDLLNLDIGHSVSLLLATFVSYLVKVFVTMVVYKYYQSLTMEGK